MLHIAVTTYILRYCFSYYLNFIYLFNVFEAKSIQKGVINRYLYVKVGEILNNIVSAANLRIATGGSCVRLQIFRSDIFKEPNFWSLLKIRFVRPPVMPTTTSTIARIEKLTSDLGQETLIYMIPFLYKK